MGFQMANFSEGEPHRPEKFESKQMPQSDVGRTMEREHLTTHDVEK